MGKTLSQFKVFGRTVKLEFVSQATLDHLAEDTECLGLYKSQTIYLQEDLQGDQLKRVLLHEIAHALFDIVGLTCLFTEGVEDAVCTTFEEFLGVVSNEEIKNILELR
jgi:hypothetical protein